MKTLNIYSGTCIKGVCGEATPLKDYFGKHLFIGDIVLIGQKDKQNLIDEFPIGRLTAVVTSKYQTYSLGEVKETGENKPFIMGIANVDIMDENSEWFVIKIKDYSNIIDGERWDDYGFNYKEDDIELRLKKENEILF